MPLLPLNAKPAKPPAPRRVRRLLAWGVFLFLALVLGVVGRGVYVFRDRHPGYVLDLDLDDATSRADPKPLQVGLARIKINPDLDSPGEPVYLAGFSQNRTATGQHDDLWAIACVLYDGHRTLAMVSLDAIGVFHDDVVRMRQRMPQGRKFDYVVVCSTHNHSTPDLMGLWGPDWRHSGVNETYREQVTAAVGYAVRDAARSLRPALVTAHEIEVPSEGLLTDTRKPVVFDPGLRLLHFTDPQTHQTIGSVVTWANHPETVWSRNREITSDFPGYLREALELGVAVDGARVEEGLGGIHLFVNGAIGGLMSTTPSVTVHDPYLGQSFKDPTHDKARALGRQLAKRIFDHLRSNPGVATDHLPISIRARTLELPLDNFGFLAAGYLGLIDRGYPRWKHVRSEVALITLGDASIACLPGEVYPELVNGGIETPPGADDPVEPVEVPPIRELMPGRVKFVFGLANDEVGYIIPRSEWDEKAPFLYGADKSPYGEVNSLGPQTAQHLHRVFLDWKEPPAGRGFPGAEDRP